MKMLQIATLLVLLLMLNCTSTKWRGSVGGEVYNYWWILDEANTMIVTNKKEIDIMLCLVELIVNIQMITNLLILIQSRLA